MTTLAKQRTSLTRRRFVAGLAAGIGLSSITPLHCALSAVRPPRPSQRHWLQAVLPSVDQKFDPFARLLVARSDDSPDSHTRIKSGDVHPIRASLNYAAALLDTGESSRVERANHILRVAIGLQDTDTFSKTHGLWPWFLEEPIAKMASPDFDSAAFCAMPLLMCWALNRDRLEPSLHDPIRAAILRATTSIRQLEVEPARTTSAILGTSLTLLASQELRHSELRSYARESLRRLHAHVVRQGSFADYNSPVDTLVALQELSRLLWLIKDSRDLSIVTALHERAWRHVAEHFHPPTDQWAGPHSRCHNTDLRKQPATLAFLQTASGNRLKFALPDPLPLSLEAYRIPIECPRKFIRHFTHLDSPRQSIETFVQPEAAKAGSLNSIAGTTWLHPKFALGTVNRGDFGNHRRPFLAHWGTPTATRFLRLRCLVDETDFSSALLFSAQHQSAVLASVSFSTNHGMAHPAASPIKNGTVVAKEIRLRFELSGDLADCTVRTMGTDKKTIVIQDQTTRFVIRPLAGSFGGAEVKWEFPELGLAKSVDVVLYSGNEKAIELEKLSEAFVCFAFEDWPYEQRELPANQIQVRSNAGRLQARWSTRGRTLSLDAPVKPASFDSMNDALRAGVA